MKLLLLRSGQGAIQHTQLQVQSLHHPISFGINHLQLRAIYPRLRIAWHLKRAPHRVSRIRHHLLRLVYVYHVGHLIGRKVIRVITTLLKVIRRHIIHKPSPTILGSNRMLRPPPFAKSHLQLATSRRRIHHSLHCSTLTAPCRQRCVGRSTCHLRLRILFVVHILRTPRNKQIFLCMSCQRATHKSQYS